jgi:4-hydroxybenzoate polyprenyltransferase
MTKPTNLSGPETHLAWSKWSFWTFGAVALLLLVLEHRAHVLGWWLHGLLALCIVLLYLLVRSEGAEAERNPSP